ncbi:MAG TPA: 50S ribosomal protein L24 [Bacillota bacterium]|jgi:large subunit ribosomal protein L24|nr:50S ribosomal protein L24 [Bacillota bacterium]
MTQKKMSIRRGDRVVVLSGKDKGKKGKVIMALPKEGRVKVEGVNMIKKHAKPTPKVPQGGIREMEAPLPVSKVMLICPACNKPTRIGKRLTADGRRVRTCKKCGEAVDK